MAAPLAGPLLGPPIHVPPPSRELLVGRDGIISRRCPVAVIDLVQAPDGVAKNTITERLDIER